MRIISRRTLVEFWESREEDAETAERDLSTWLKVAKKANWANFAALSQSFGSADRVGYCVVFDVGNNRYRLIGMVRYSSIGKGIIDVRKVMDHAEYDRKKWPQECACLTPAPKKPKTAAKPSSSR